MMGGRAAARALFAARVAFFAALVLVATAGRHWIRIDTAESGASSALDSATSPARMPSAPAVDVSALIARDPFSPLRLAPDVPYRIGGDASGPAVAVARQPVILLGTVVRPSGRSFAMCQVAGEAPRVLYPGQRIGGLMLESVMQGSVVFTDDNGTRVTMRVTRTGS